MARLRKVNRLIEQLQFLFVSTSEPFSAKREGAHIAKQLAGAFPLDADGAVSQPGAVPTEDQIGCALLRKAFDVAVWKRAPARARGGPAAKGSVACRF